MNSNHAFAIVLHSISIEPNREQKKIWIQDKCSRLTPYALSTFLAIFMNLFCPYDDNIMKQQEFMAYNFILICYLEVRIIISFILKYPLNILT
jgi:hypothetical protein